MQDGRSSIANPLVLRLSKIRFGENSSGALSKLICCKNWIIFSASETLPSMIGTVTKWVQQTCFVLSLELRLLDTHPYPHYHLYDDVIKWKHFPRYWPFVRGIHRCPVNSPHKGQWRGALMFSLICTRINGWVNNHEAGDLRRHRVHYDVIEMISFNLNIRSLMTEEYHHVVHPEHPNKRLTAKNIRYKIHCLQIIKTEAIKDLIVYLVGASWDRGIK